MNDINARIISALKEVLKEQYDLDAPEGILTPALKYPITHRKGQIDE